MSLINKHSCSINKLFVIVDVVKSSSIRSTSANCCVRLYSSTEIVLLTVSIEYTFELDFSHTGLYFSQHLNMTFNCQYSCPSHNINFFFTFNCSAFTKDFIKCVGIDIKFSNILSIWNNVRQTRVTVITLVNINGLRILFLKPVLKLINI